MGIGGPERVCAGEMARLERDKGRWEQHGQEVSPGPIKRVYSAGRVYGSRVGWRLGQGVVRLVLAEGSPSKMCFPGLANIRERGVS